MLAYVETNVDPKGLNYTMIECWLPACGLLANWSLIALRWLFTVWDMPVVSQRTNKVSDGHIFTYKWPNANSMMSYFVMSFYWPNVDSSKVLTLPERSRSHTVCHDQMPCAWHSRPASLAPVMTTTYQLNDDQMLTTASRHRTHTRSACPPSRAPTTIP